MNWHPSAAVLQRWVESGLPDVHLRAVTAHILSGCSTCGRILTRLALGGSPETPLPPAQDYDEALDRAYATVRALLPRLPAFRSAAAIKSEALALLASRGLAGLEAAPPDLQGLPLVEALLERSADLRSSDRNQMVELAHCAALVADRLSASELGAKEVADLRCRAWVALANAYRLAGDLDQADAALERATDQFLLGSGDDFLGARFFMALAAEYAVRGHFKAAAASLQAVVELYGRHLSRHKVGLALIENGISIGEEGDPEVAICWLDTGLASVDEERAPAQVGAALQEKARLLACCGRYREARRALWEFRRRSSGAGATLSELEVRWLEGRIFAGLGDLERAERALLQVKEGFEEAALPCKAALAGLELGLVWLRQERLEEASEIASECAETFLSLEIAPELLASLFLLQEASKTRQLTLGLLEKVMASLRDLDRHPADPLQPAAEG